MTVFEDIESFRKSFAACAATIGKYDGMHLGHQHIVDTLLAQARHRMLPSVVLLSEPQPEEFFTPDQAPARLTHFRDKVDFLHEAGVDAVFRMNFDRAFSEMPARDFVDRFLVTGLGVRTLIVGDDFRFGRSRGGDIQLLRDKGAAHGFDVIRVPPREVEGSRVSSTRVRESLRRGDCEHVRRLLGRYFSISGEVISGNKLGRELGTPTANIALEVNRLPLLGIYSVLVRLHGRVLRGVASAGFNPTVSDDNLPRLEVYIFDFDENIYGERISVSFVRKLRDEVRFDNLDALKQQIARDIEQARAVFESRAHTPAEANG